MFLITFISQSCSTVYETTNYPFHYFFTVTILHKEPTNYVLGKNVISAAKYQLPNYSSCYYWLLHKSNCYYRLLNIASVINGKRIINELL